MLTLLISHTQHTHAITHMQSHTYRHAHTHAHTYTHTYAHTHAHSHMLLYACVVRANMHVHRVHVLEKNVTFEQYLVASYYTYS